MLFEQYYIRKTGGVSTIRREGDGTIQEGDKRRSVEDGRIQNGSDAFS